MGTQRGCCQSQFERVTGTEGVDFYSIKFVSGDDSKITTDVSIDKEAIVHQILLTDRYSVTFESVSVFDSNFEAAANLANTLNAGKILVDLEQAARKQVTVTVNDGNEYLIALKVVDWDDL